MKQFSMKSTDYAKSKPILFDEETAPKWLKEGGYPGSTMDNRWFWNGYVLTLEVGASIKTDFQTITRVA